VIHQLLHNYSFRTDPKLDEMKQKLDPLYSGLGVWAGSQRLQRGVREASDEEGVVEGWGGETDEKEDIEEFVRRTFEGDGTQSSQGNTYREWVEADEEAKDIAAFVQEVAQLSKQLLTMGFEETRVSEILRRQFCFHDAFPLLR
jgi:hypothetical protein